MSGLGVSMNFTREKNLEIIRKQFKKDAKLTCMQVNYLSRFTWVKHKKGLNFPECKCLRCEGMKKLEGLEKWKV